MPPPRVEAFALNTEMGFAESLTTTNERYNILNDKNSGVDWE